MSQQRCDRKVYAGDALDTMCTQCLHLVRDHVGPQGCIWCNEFPDLLREIIKEALDK